MKSNLKIRDYVEQLSPDDRAMLREYLSLPADRDQVPDMMTMRQRYGTRFRDMTSRVDELRRAARIGYTELRELLLAELRQYE